MNPNTKQENIDKRWANEKPYTEEEILAYDPMATPAGRVAHKINVGMAEASRLVSNVLKAHGQKPK